MGSCQPCQLQLVVNFTGKCSKSHFLGKPSKPLVNGQLTVLSTAHRAVDRAVNCPLGSWQPCRLPNGQLTAPPTAAGRASTRIHGNLKTLCISAENSNFLQKKATDQNVFRFRNEGPENAQTVNSTGNLERSPQTAILQFSRNFA